MECDLWKSTQLASNSQTLNPGLSIPEDPEGSSPHGERTCQTFDPCLSERILNEGINENLRKTGF